MHSRFTAARVAAAAALIAGIGVTAAACGRYSYSSLVGSKAYKDANTLYGKQQYQQAALKYQEAIDYNPTLVGEYFFLGNCYDQLYKPAKKGDPTNDGYLVKAVEGYKLATERETDPKWRKLSFQYLIASYGSDRLNDFAKAEPVAKQLIALDPNDPEPYMGLGKLYEDTGRFDEAEASLKKAVDLKPTDSAGYLTLAGFYLRQGKFEKTMEALEARAKNEPNNPEAYHYMSTFYEQKVEKDLQLDLTKKHSYILKGIANEDKALALNPEYAEAMVYKGILMRMLVYFEKDRKKVDDILKQAEDLRIKAIELQKKQGKKGG